MADIPEGLSTAAKVRWRREARKQKAAAQQSVPADGAPRSAAASARSPRIVQPRRGPQTTAAVAASVIQAWCRGRQLRVQMKQPPSALAGMTPECLSCAIRCAWSYNEHTLQRAAASRLASVLAATERAPSAIVALQAASDLLGGIGNTSDLVIAVLGERVDTERIYARHLAGRTFDFTSAALICELIQELSRSQSQHSMGDVSDSVLPPAAPARPTTPPRAQRAPAYINRDKVDSQIERLESIEKTVHESAQRLAEVKRQMQAGASAPTEEHANSRCLTRHSMTSLQERCSTADARIQKLVQRHAILGQRIAFAAREHDPDDGDASAGNGEFGRQLLPEGHLERLRLLLLRAGSAPGRPVDALSYNHRGIAEWRRLLQPFADEAGRLTWRRFREAILSILYVPSEPAQTAAATSDLALHALFDTLDVRCSDTVLIDEVHRFLCTELVEDYLRELQSSVSLQIHAARSEAAGLQAWIQAKKGKDVAPDDLQFGPTAGCEFEVYVGDQAVPSYKPFLAQDRQRLTSTQRQLKWREQTWSQVRNAIEHRKVFGRRHSFASELFGSMAIRSDGPMADGAGPTLILYDDVVKVLHRLGLGFTAATIAELLSDVDVDPIHGTVHLDTLLDLLSPSVDTVDEREG